MTEFQTILGEIGALRKDVSALSVSLASCQSASNARIAVEAARAAKFGSRSSWISAGAAVAASLSALYSFLVRH